MSFIGDIVGCEREEYNLKAVSGKTCQTKEQAT
jgi:hypothetical protein